MIFILSKHILNLSFFFFLLVISKSQSLLSAFLSYFYFKEFEKKMSISFNVTLILKMCFSLIFAQIKFLHKSEDMLIKKDNTLVKKNILLNSLRIIPQKMLDHDLNFYINKYLCICKKLLFTD